MSDSSARSAREFRQALLRSARLDDPPPRALEDAASVLGLASGALSVPASPVAAKLGVKALVAAFQAASPLKLVFVGVACGLAVGGVYVTASSLGPAGESPAPVASAARQVEDLAAPAGNALPTRTPELPAREPDVTPAPALASAPRPRSAASTPATAPEQVPESAGAALAEVSIREQVAAVDRARNAVRQGRPSEALDEVAAYRSRWPNGPFATEVLVLRVEALLANGQRDLAWREAEAFIAAQPGSRYSARLRSLFEAHP